MNPVRNHLLENHIIFIKELNKVVNIKSSLYITDVLFKHILFLTG